MIHCHNDRIDWNYRDRIDLDEKKNLVDNNPIDDEIEDHYQTTVVDLKNNFYLFDQFHTDYSLHTENSSSSLVENDPLNLIMDTNDEEIISSKPMRTNLSSDWLKRISLLSIQSMNNCCQKRERKRIINLSVRNVFCR